MSGRRDAIEQELVGAFAAMPGRPFYRLPYGLQAHAGGRTDRDVTAILNEAATVLAADGSALRYLLAWARCQARGVSFGEYCREMGWNRATAEKGRRRGAAAIARSRAATEPAA